MRGEYVPDERAMARRARMAAAAATPRADRPVDLRVFDDSMRGAADDGRGPVRYIPRSWHRQSTGHSAYVNKSNIGHR
jgi:hypothetical protein